MKRLTSLSYGIGLPERAGLWRDTFILEDIREAVRRLEKVAQEDWDKLRPYQKEFLRLRAEGKHTVVTMGARGGKKHMESFWRNYGPEVTAKLTGNLYTEIPPIECQGMAGETFKAAEREAVRLLEKTRVETQAFDNMTAQEVAEAINTNDPHMLSLMGMQPNTWTAEAVEGGATLTVKPDPQHPKAQVLSETSEGTHPVYPQTYTRRARKETGQVGDP